MHILRYNFVNFIVSLFCQVKSQEKKTRLKELPLLTWAGIYSCILIQFCSVPDKLSDKRVWSEYKSAHCIAHMALFIDSSLYLPNHTFMPIEFPCFNTFLQFINKKVYHANQVSYFIDLAAELMMKLHNI